MFSVRLSGAVPGQPHLFGSTDEYFLRCFQFLSTIYLMNRIAMFKLDRFLSHKEEKTRPDYIEVIEEECRGCLSSDMVMRSVWMILCISSCFYTIFLFDTTTEGVSGAFIRLYCVPVVGESDLEWERRRPIEGWRQ